jgi:multiple sugar transport system permease protein
MKTAKFARHIVLIVLSLIWLSPIYLLINNAMANTKNYMDNFDWKFKGFEPAANFKAAWAAADLTPGLISNVIYGVFGALASVALVSSCCLCNSCSESQR